MQRLPNEATDMKPKEPNTDELDFDPVDVDEAAQENTDLGVEPAPELPPGTANLTTWDEAPDAKGHAVPNRMVDEDENQVGADLVEGGVESADRDQRLAASDPDYEA
jgi:hypothetical protein